MIDLLDERIDLAEEIGRIKREKNLPITDADREEEVLNRAGIYQDIFEMIISTCKEREDER